MTPFGQLAFFIEFLKTAGLWEGWVQDCAVTYTSPNAPTKAEVLGTILLSVLAGHRRYAHITALRFDGVNPQANTLKNGRIEAPTGEVIRVKLKRVSGV